MGNRLYKEQPRLTGNAMPLGFLNAGHSAVCVHAAAIAKTRSLETVAMLSQLPGLRFDTAKGSATFSREDHQALCDLNFIRIRSSRDAKSMNINSGDRQDNEVT